MNVATMLNNKLDFYCCDNSVRFCKSSHIYIYHFVWADQRLLQGNISYIALLRGQYLDIAREGGFQSSFHPHFDPTFDLKVVQHNTPVIYIVDLITFTCGIEFTIF